MKMRAGAMAGALVWVMMAAPVGSQQMGPIGPIPPDDPMGPSGAGMPLPASSTGSGRNAGSRQPSQPTIPHTPEDDPANLGKPTERQIQAMNEQRQKQIVTDTDKLLALAMQLKADVDKSSKDTLSLDVVKKADEIERLAHSVKDKMRN